VERSGNYLRRAAGLALSGRFRVEPNPLVGCLLVRGGRVVGQGYHAFWGGPHAEIAALEEAGGRARGATAYVTLEPCGHKGKTPPCAEALARAGVAEVVYAAKDPNPETAGLGPARLKQAGIRVRRKRAPALVRAILEAYLSHLDSKRPWVIAKWAMTLDGRIASRSGDSRWITADKTRRWVHRHFRGRVDAILVGAGTIRADDPALTNRSGRGHQPLRVVVCGRRPLPPRAQVLRDGKPTLLAVPEHLRVSQKLESVVCGRSGRVDLVRLLRKLHARGMRRILVEGGGDILGGLFDRRCVDQVLVFLAPSIVGGVTAVAPVGGRGQARMEEAYRLDPVGHRTLGPDQVVEGHVRYGTASPAGQPPVSRRSPGAGRS